MSLDLEQLEKLARAATPGPWEFSTGSGADHWELWSTRTGEWVVQDDAGVEPSLDNLAYFAAMCPTTALELIAELKAYRERDRLSRLGDQIADATPQELLP